MRVKGHASKQAVAQLDDAELFAEMTWLLEYVAPKGMPQRLFDPRSTMSAPENVSVLIEACKL